jgi:histidyl-tRNA synthetase
VRGLDYYTRTVWEFTSTALGAQSTVGAGGRYDGLVQQLGGPETPAVGFGSGIERIVMCLEALGQKSTTRPTDAYVGVQPDAGDAAWMRAFRIATQLRERGRYVELDLGSRSVKGQAKQASKLDAALRVLVDDLGARMFLHGHPGGTRDGTDLPSDIDASIGQVDAQLVAIASITSRA